MNEYAHKIMLKEICKERVVESYLEIGVNRGDSLRVVLENSNDLKTLYLCDDWKDHYGGEGKGNNKHIKILITEYEYNGKVVFLNGDSKMQIPRVTQKFNLILVDGDHSAEGTMEDLNNCWPLLEVGGLILLDDITHESHSYLEGIFHRFNIQHEHDSAVYKIDKVNPNGVAVLEKIEEQEVSE